VGPVSHDFANTHQAAVEFYSMEFGKHLTLLVLALKHFVCPHLNTFQFQYY